MKNYCLFLKIAERKIIFSKNIYSIHINIIFQGRTFLIIITNNMSKSLLSQNQRKEVLKRSALYKAGKAKVYTIGEARKKLKQRSGK